MSGEDIEWIKDSLKRIEDRLENSEKDCRSRHSQIDISLATLIVRAGMYGAIAGAIPAVVAVVAMVLRFSQ